MKNFKRFAALGMAALMLMPSMTAAAEEGSVTGDSHIEGVKPENIVRVVLPTVTNNTYKFVLDPADLLSQYAENKTDYDKPDAGGPVYFSNLNTAASVTVNGGGKLYKDAAATEEASAAEIIAVIQALSSPEDATELTGLYKSANTVATYADVTYTAPVYKYTNTSDVATAVNKGNTDVVLTVKVSVTNVTSNPVKFVNADDVSTGTDRNVAVQIVPTAKGTVTGSGTPTAGAVTAAQAVDVSEAGTATMTFLVAAKADNFTIKQEADATVTSGHKYVWEEKDADTSEWHTVGFALSAVCNGEEGVDWSAYNTASQKLTGGENLKVKVVYSMTVPTESQKAELDGKEASATAKEGVKIYKDTPITTEATDAEILAAYDADDDHSDGITGLYTANDTLATDADIVYSAEVAALTADGTTGVVEFQSQGNENVLESDGTNDIVIYYEGSKPNAVTLTPKNTTGSDKTVINQAERADRVVIDDEKVIIKASWLNSMATGATRGKGTYTVKVSDTTVVITLK